MELLIRKVLATGRRKMDIVISSARQYKKQKIKKSHCSKVL
jgi:hypothetical protein